MPRKLHDVGDIIRKKSHGIIIKYVGNVDAAMGRKAIMGFAY